MSTATTIDRHAPEHSENGILSVEFIRAQFPALTRLEQGHPVAYFDGPGGTQVPRLVGESMTQYLYHHNANTHWVYPTSVETDALLARARETLGDFLGAGANEIAFGANMTTLLFHVARAIGRGLQAGDEIIITELDHHANVAPWQALAKERGVVLKWLPLDLTTYRHEEGALERLLSPRTKVVAVGAASNITGTISDVAQIVRTAKAAGALTVVDAVHYAPHALVDVKAIDCDFLLCSAYKFYGPHIGIVYGRAEVVGALDVPRLEPAPDWVPEILETGTQNHEGIVGAAAAVEFLAGLGGPQGPRRERLARAMHGLHARGEALLARLWNGLSAIDGVTCHGPRPGTPRTPTISFRVAGHPSEAVARFLVPRGVYVSNGDFYATTVARKLGVADEGLVRAGCSCYTTADEVERLIDGVQALVRGAR